MKHGEIERAVAEFEEAYRIRPNYSVLYNLGQSYMVLGKPVEAAQALEKYLDAGASKLDPARIKSTRETIAVIRRRIGYLRLAVIPSQAAVFVDGYPLNETEKSQSIALAVGSHRINVLLDGYRSVFENVVILSTVEVGVSVSLQHEVSIDVARQGQLAVRTEIPEIQIEVDDSRVEAVSSGPILLAVGKHRITCERPGYVASRQEVEVAVQGITRVDCQLVPLRIIAASQSAAFFFDVSPIGAQLTIDGSRSRNLVRLPLGSHIVAVHRSGYEDSRQTVVVRSPMPTTVKVRLRVTPEHARELAMSRWRQNWGKILGGAGSAALGVGIATYAINSGYYSSWKQDRDALARTPDAQQQASRTADLQSRALAIQQRDDLALSASVIGGLLISTALAMWLSSTSIDHGIAHP